MARLAARIDVTSAAAIPTDPDIDIDIDIDVVTDNDTDTDTAMNRPASRPLLAALSLALISAGVLLVLAAPASASAHEVARLPADLQRVYAPAANAQPARTRARAADGSNGDTKPPQLTGFTLPKSFDATAPGGDARVSFSATDNGSGVYDGSFVLVGPNGASMTGWFGDDVPAAKVQKGRGYLEGSPWAVPGTWSLQSVRVYDYSGNGATWDHDQLVAMGIATDMTVVNRKGGDADPPTLVGGHLRSTTFSLSAVQPGTVDAYAVFAVDVHMRDAGNPQVSGVRLAQLTFCLDDQSRSMNVISTNNQASGGTDATVTAWQIPAQVRLVPGYYRLKEVVLFDFAGNRRTMTSAAFGGDTDFAPLFDGAPDLVVTN